MIAPIKCNNYVNAKTAYNNFLRFFCALLSRYIPFLCAFYYCYKSIFLHSENFNTYKKKMYLKIGIERAKKTYYFIFAYDTFVLNFVLQQFNCRRFVCMHSPLQEFRTQLLTCNVKCRTNTFPHFCRAYYSYRAGESIDTRRSIQLRNQHGAEQYK